MKKVYTCLFFFISIIASAQESDTKGFLFLGKKPLKNYVGIRFGGIAGTFAEKNNLSIPSLGNKSMISWHAGVSCDMFTSKKYSARLELSYVNKGAEETFGNERVAIQSNNKLTYLQLSALPLIIKPGFRKINPYLAIGGYYAHRLSIHSEASVNNGPWETDRTTAANFDIKNDYGYSVSLGMYIWQRPLFELRYEAGIPSVSSTSTIKNRSIILSFSI